jgi:hypothetical protein
MRSDAAVGIVALVMRAHCRIARNRWHHRDRRRGLVVWSECSPTLPSASNSTHRQFQRDACEYGDQCGVASGEQVGGYRLDPSRFRSAVSRERWLWRLPGPIAQHSRPPSSGGAPDRSAGPAPFHHPLVDLQAARSAGIASLVRSSSQCWRRKRIARDSASLYGYWHILTDMHWIGGPRLHRIN